MEERDDVRTLEISKVALQDAGLYRITIDNDLGREQATARLDVISKLEFNIIPEGFLSPVLIGIRQICYDDSVLRNRELNSTGVILHLFVCRGIR